MRLRRRPIFVRRRRRGGVGRWRAARTKQECEWAPSCLSHGYCRHARPPNVPPLTSSRISKSRDHRWTRTSAWCVFRCIRSVVPGPCDQDSGDPIKLRSEATSTGMVRRTVGSRAGVSNLSGGACPRRSPAAFARTFTNRRKAAPERLCSSRRPNAHASSVATWAVAPGFFCRLVENARLRSSSR